MIHVKSADDLIALIGKTVVFEKGILDAEDYAEPGMWAKVESVTFNCHGEEEKDFENNSVIVHIIKFNFEGFEEHNKSFETHTFWKGDNLVSARDAGWYKKVDSYYFGCDLPFNLLEPVMDIKEEVRKTIEALLKPITLRMPTPYADGYNQAIKDCLEILKKSS